MTTTTNFNSENYFCDIISLQLKKPKSWSWQLTTSKSSPHISLPVIKLYDCKGHLLVEAKDNGKIQRNSWHSEDTKLIFPENTSSRYRDFTSPRLQRCRSDTFNRNFPKISPQRKHELSIEKEKRRLSANKLDTVYDEKPNTSRCSPRIEIETFQPLNCNKEVDSNNNIRGLQKSRSEIFPNNGYSLFPYTKQNTSSFDVEHRRTRSDDVFKRKLKTSEESLKRAEIDGYKNFIISAVEKGQTPTSSEQKLNDKSPALKTEKNKTRMTSENIISNNNAFNIEVNHFTHKRYKTRTCSAGTLIISEESFNNSNRRRRSRRELGREIAENGNCDHSLVSDCRDNASNSPEGIKRNNTASVYAAKGDEFDKSASEKMASDILNRRNSPISNFILKEKTLFNKTPITHSLSYVGAFAKTDRLNYPTENEKHLRIKRSVSMSESGKPINKAATVRKNAQTTKLYRPNSSSSSSEYDGRKCNGAEKILKKSSSFQLDQPMYLNSHTRRLPNLERNASNGDKYAKDLLLNREIFANNYRPRRSISAIYVPRSRCENVLPILKTDDLVLNRSPHSNNKNHCRDGYRQLKESTIQQSNPEKQKKRRKVCRRKSDASSTSSTKVNLEKFRLGHVFAKENGAIDDIPTTTIKQYRDTDSKRGDIIHPARRFAPDHHVKMGANVSRHSSKGLSGRRSQSSGSICNGKGRHSDGKICGSLPSYLDDRNSSCNNNHHDCEKPPIDEVSRIPPLGDGAPLHWKFSDTQTALCDQGYGSERSPEEEYPPPLPEHDSQCHHHLEPHACYPFITPESTFAVRLTKGSRGLGLSVTGGIDSGGSWPGLIRIKRLFPLQPAMQCGYLNVGDLLLEANGITLTGLTNYEALEVLRTTSNQVELKVCRPPPDVLSCVSPISEVPPPPPRREPPSSLNLPHGSYINPEDDYYHGEFEVTLNKIQGSLGFTLRKEDDSALGHYVRALVREPALTDGRIKAGDKIIAVNDVEISSMSHEQAVQFLRQCGDVVKLRLYRDAAQTPVAALSPTETTPRASFSSAKKPHLRQEAVDMLNDIAVRKLIPGNQEASRRSQSPVTSPRKLRRQPCPSDASQNNANKYTMSEEEFHEGLLQQCSRPYDDDPYNSLFIVDTEDGDRPSRPSSLELYNPNQTPVAARKPRFNFSLAHNAYELNNLDAEVLDAPNLTYNLGNDNVKSTELESDDNYPKEPASMPHIPLDNPGFSHKNPAYQSAHPPCGTDKAEDKSSKSSNQDDTNMKKWKGVVFDGKEEEASNAHAAPPMIREENEVLAIELNRGWNSRLGFSLQGAAGVTYVSAVHPDSVAARDGRLKPGDRVIKVNDESVEHMNTSEIIDLLRIVRGPVCIVVSRTNTKEDCLQSNEAN